MQEVRVQRHELTSAHALLAGFLLAGAAGAAVIGSFPLEASIVTIFLFAGAHNFMEFRYFDSTLRAEAIKADVTMVLGMAKAAVENRAGRGRS